HTHPGGATMKRRVVIMVALAVCFALPHAAEARSPAIGPASLTLNPAVGPPTTKTKAIGARYLAGEAVAVSFDGARVGLVVADATGRFTTAVTVVRAAEPGLHALTAHGQSSELDARAVFRVRAQASAREPQVTRSPRQMDGTTT